MTATSEHPHVTTAPRPRAPRRPDPSRTALRAVNQLTRDGHTRLDALTIVRDQLANTIAAHVAVRAKVDRHLAAQWRYCADGVIDLAAADTAVVTRDGQASS